MMQRRTLLQTALAVLAWRPFTRRAWAQPAFGDAHVARLAAVGAAVLPQEIGADAQRAAVEHFARWVRDYRTDAEADHGYGVPRLRRMPASPAEKYPAQLDDLDRRAGGTFAVLAPAERQRVIREALDGAGVRDLPGRPNGAHIAADLMSHYFRSPAANDLAYGRRIGRDACRELKGSDQRPPLLAGRAGGR